MDLLFKNDVQKFGRNLKLKLMLASMCHSLGILSFNLVDFKSTHILSVIT